MVLIDTIPNVICIGCGYTSRLDDEEYHNKLIESLDTMLYRDYELLSSYKDLDTSLYFIIKITDDGPCRIWHAMSIIDALGDVDFCSFCKCNNITTIDLRDDCILIDVDTESG